MDIKKDTEVAEIERLQNPVTPSSVTNLEEEEKDRVVQRNFLASLSVYNQARETIKLNGLDYNVLMESFLKLICKNEGYDYALLQGRLSITTTTNNQTYVQEAREKSNPPVQNKGFGASEKESRHSP